MCIRDSIGGVDPAARDYILSTILNNYSRDATVILSTHLSGDIEPILDEAVFLKDGRVFAHRNAEELRETEGMSVDAVSYTHLYSTSIFCIQSSPALKFAL